MENPVGWAKETLKTAHSLVAGKNYGRAFAHFLLALTLDPSLKNVESSEDVFIDCLKCWSAELVSMERSQDAVWCYEQACDVWTNSAKVLHATGQFLFNFGYHSEGVSFLQKAVGMESHQPDWLWDLQNASSSLVERWHFRMLNDGRRNQCYYEALKNAVKRGHQKIIDIGSGTGLLSMLAVKAGAENVTAVELDDVMCSLSKDIIKQNQMMKNINVMKMKSTAMHSLADQDRYTLVVTETADAGLLGEGIIPTLQHAWKHILKSNESGMDRGDGAKSPTSQVIPSSATVYIQLIQSDFIRRQHRVHRKGIDPFLGKTEIVSKSVCTTLDPSFATNEETEPYSSENLACIPGVWQPLTAPHQVYRFDFDNSEILTTNHLTESIIELPVTHHGRPDAIISWFDLHLDADISISSAPDAGTCWEQAVYPIHPTHINQGENINNDGVNLHDSVKISCRCYPTWMSFRLKEVARKPKPDSNAVCLNVDTRNHWKENTHILQLPSKDIATLNDEKYCSWLQNLIGENFTANVNKRKGGGDQGMTADLKRDKLNVHQKSKDAMNETVSGVISFESPNDGSECPKVMMRHQESEYRTLNEKNFLKEVKSEVSSATEGSDTTQGILEAVHFEEHGCCVSRNLSEKDPCDMTETYRERRVTILDLSVINLSYFTCSFLDLPRMEAIGLTPLADGETLLDKIVNCNRQTNDRFMKISVETAENESLNHVKLIILDLVESGGVLRKNALEDVYFVGLKIPTQNEVKVIPEVLKIHAVCVESTELSNNARISGSDPTLGISVDLMNTFKTSTQLYVCLSKLPHKELTDKFEIFTFDLKRLVKNENPMEIFTQTREVTLEAKVTGRLSAIVYWFEMRCDKSTLSTKDEETHWMQAAFILDEDVVIQCGKMTKLKAYFRNNSMSFSLIPIPT